MKTLFLSLSSLTCTSISATGLNFWETSTLNSALASANGASAVDASILALAPSSITQLEQSSLSASVTYYDVTTDYNIFGDESKYNTKNPIPMGFVTTEINDSYFFGLAVYSRTAADIVVPKIPFINPKETRVKPILVSVSPTLAYAHGNLSVAASLEYIHTAHTLEQTTCIFNVCDKSLEEGTTSGWTGALSATWKVTSTTSLAFTHRFSTSFGDQDISVELPSISSVYGTLMITPKTAWHASYSYSTYDGKGVRYANYTDPIGLLVGYQNSQRIATSIDHKLGHWSLRGGISLDEAIDRLGGIDKRYRLGVGYQFTKQFTLNAAWVYEDYAIKEAAAGDTTLVKVQNSGSALSLGIQYDF
ncbi:OmpP1/FadL family transporter [Thalassotalea agarivorans]|uniref:OmpP1/FadL family transporter n=1 Tax=Thalassotalea agarivorans TaxID=349064 RepID=UPI0015A53E13|nr:outer membrane protein transport protein [Thalassotalea agarivorans]